MYALIWLPLSYVFLFACLFVFLVRGQIIIIILENPLSFFKGTMIFILLLLFNLFIFGQAKFDIAGVQNPSTQTRNQTHAPYNGSTVLSTGKSAGSNYLTLYFCFFIWK